MTEFHTNELVDITIKGVRFAKAPTPGALVLGATILDETGMAFHMPPQAVIERVAPAEWPPRKNDVWCDGSGELLIGAVWAAEGPVLRSVDGSQYDTAHALDRLAPLTLIHREQQDGGEQS